MELKGRLKIIASKVIHCKKMCDIGTDHAYIPIYLVEKKVCESAIAADVREGPLDAARANIKHCGLQSKIETRLGNGLAPIQMGETDCVVIAGMGGALISEIVRNDLDKAKDAKLLILQPMNGIEFLREWLYQEGFEIVDEELVEEGEKLYTVISAKYVGIISKHEKIDFYIGEKLVERGGWLLKKLLERKLALSEKILTEINYSKEVDETLKQLHEYLATELRRLLLKG